MRVFVALPLPPEIRRSLCVLKGDIVGGRWVDEESLHLTLRFIGEVSGDEAVDLDTELAFVRGKPFDLALGGIGYFEKKGRIHTVWAGVERSDELLRLRERVESAAVRAGFGPDGRKYKPHVTLARFKSGSDVGIGPFLEMHNDFASPSFRVEQFVLYRSHLNHGGARYEVVAEYPLV